MDSATSRDKPGATRDAWQRDVHHLQRSDVDREYQLWVATSPRYAVGDASHPLVLCLDAHWTWGTTLDVARILGLGRELPDLIVAGITYATDDWRQVVQLRAMDSTVTAVDAPPETGVRLPGHQLGGAEPFRRWLDSAVIPLLRERYRVADLTLLGHSFTALFGLHVLLTTPEAYGRYLLASPSVWWDAGVMFSRIDALAELRGDLPADVFISSGGLETGPMGRHEELSKHLARKRFAGLQQTFVRFPDEHHNSVINASISRGLRVLFAGHQPPGSSTRRETSGVNRP